MKRSFYLATVLVFAPCTVHAAAGDLDPKFGNAGTVQTNFTGKSDYAFALAFQGDGKIVVAGQSGVYPDLHSALVRYNRNGTLDRTFGTGGKVAIVLDPAG